MFESDLCNGFLLGFLTAGVIGFIIQRLLLLNRKAGMAGKKVALVEVKQSPKEVYMSSMRAQTEIAIWLILLIVVVVAVVWIYFS
ncbi:MAG: hypothetical protein ACK2UU_09795 [Anaerolineae bacterium]